MALSSLQLVAALADGQFHTGDALGLRFGVSKGGIWKAMRKLEGLGLDVHSVRGKGYRLSEPLTLLNAEHIRANLPPSRRAELSGLELLPQVDSTNAHLLRQAQAGAGVVGDRDDAARGLAARAPRLDVEVGDGVTGSAHGVSLSATRLLGYIRGRASL